MAGYSIGGLLFPSATQFFFDEYGFRGALLLCGGTMLNAAAGTLLQRIPPPVQPETIWSQAAQSCGEEDVSGGATAAARDLPGSSNVPARLKNTHVTQSGNGCVRGPFDNQSNSSRIHNTHYHQYRDEGVIVQGLEPSAHGDGMETATQIPALSYEKGLASLKEAHPTHTTKGNVSSELAEALSIQYAFHTEEPACNKRTLSCPAQYKHSTKDKITSLFEHRWSRCKGSRACTHVFIAQTARRKPPGSKSRLQALKELFRFLAIPKYYSVLLSAIVILTNNAVYTTTIIDFALDRGIDRWRALTLITANTALDLTARFSTGWATDRELISRSTLMAFCLAVWAATDFCFAFFRSYAALVAVSAVAGWCNGSALPTLPVLCMEIMDIGHFTIAYGLCSFIAGLVGLAIPSLTG
ncbi:hypothetical protein HPB48_007463 [Haemaphysalis longicornis]|uniref:Monocarboxylate transporter n=1 Tax=Haemaphysalis longicornis TaxID=44386 RepID=A0A9J6GG30_HAELO|nr:hypothetical protein HPB48_007463 [Haemaphysalis longicornis]